MAFKLRSQSPITQTNYVYDNSGLGNSPLEQKKSFAESLKGNKPMFDKMSQSLKKSNKNIAKLDPTGKKRKAIYSDDENANHWLDTHPLSKAAIQIADPTGITSHHDVAKSWGDKKLGLDDILNPISAIPVIGNEEKVVVKGFNLVKGAVKSASKLYKGFKAANLVGDSYDAYQGIKDSASSPNKQLKSPLHKQKLSPKAAKAKAARDLAYAKTPDRRAKKADDQRRHRHDPRGKGKDWDHEDGRWEDPHQNRGNDGNGTKSEHGKNYKINKKS